MGTYNIITLLICFIVSLMITRGVPDLDKGAYSIVEKIILVFYFIGAFVIITLFSSIKIGIDCLRKVVKNKTLNKIAFLLSFLVGFQSLTLPIPIEAKILIACAMQVLVVFWVFRLCKN